MEISEAAKYMSYCINQLNLKVYCVTIGQNNRVRLAVLHNGKESIKETVYSTEPKQSERKYWDVINEIYKKYYELNFK